MIPLILQLHIKEKTKRGFNLWLPLFLIWLIVLPLLLIPAPLILLMSLILWPAGKGKFILNAYLTIFRLIGSMSGVEIDRHSKNSIVCLNLK